MNEEQAKKKTCPLLSDKCIGSECISWREKKKIVPANITNDIPCENGAVSQAAKKKGLLPASTSVGLNTESTGQSGCIFIGR